jgi:hypothetical protein
MFRKLGLLALTFAVGLTLAGCGASTIWAEGTLDEGVASLAPMAMMNFEGAGSAVTGAGAVPLGSSAEQLFTRAALSPQAACELGGSTTTGEQNGATFTAFNDCKESDGSGSGGYVVANGTLWEQYGEGEEFHVWTDPSLAVEYFDSADDMYMAFYVDVDAELTARGSGFDLDYYLDFGMSDGTDTFSMLVDVVYGYDPDSDAAPMDAGTITFDGTMRFRATEAATDSRTEYNLTMKTVPSLHHDASLGCIDSGAAEYSDGVNVLRIESNGCGNEPTVTYNGDPYTVSPAALGIAPR